MTKKLKLFAGLFLALFLQQSAIAQNLFGFTNLLYCNQPITAEVEYFDCNAISCYTDITSWQNIPPNANVGSTGWPSCNPACDAVITLTQINGCPISPPVVIKWSDAISAGGKTSVSIPPSQTNCYCTEPGTAIWLDANTHTVYVF